MFVRKICLLEKKITVCFNIKYNYYYIIFDSYKHQFYFFFEISNVGYFEGFMIILSHYFAETAMGVDVHAQKKETKYTTTIHRFEKSL